MPPRTTPSHGLGGANRRRKDQRTRRQRRGEEKGSVDESYGGLTIHIEGVVSLVAAHVTGGRAAVGATVALVEEGEDQALPGPSSAVARCPPSPTRTAGGWEAEKLECSGKSRAGSQRRRNKTANGEVKDSVMGA